MQKAYWKEASKRAWAASAKLLRIESTDGILVLLLTQSVIGFLLWHMGNGPGSQNNIWTRIGTFLAPFVLAPLIFVWQLIATPARIDADLKARIEALEASQNNEGLQRSKRDTIAAFMACGSNLYRDILNDAASLEDTNTWAEDVYNYLNKNVGNSYATRFANDTAHSKVLIVGYKGERSEEALWVGRRVQRLERFLQEL